MRLLWKASRSEEGNCSARLSQPWTSASCGIQVSEVMSTSSLLMKEEAGETPDGVSVASDRVEIPCAMLSHS